MSNDRLTIFSKRMATVILWFIAAMLLLNAMSWLLPARPVANGGYQLQFLATNELISRLNLNINAFPWWQTLGSIVISSLPLLAFALGLQQLRLLFRCYANGEFFSSAAAIHLGKSGKWIAIAVVLNLVCEPLLSAFVTLLRPAGQRMATLNISSSDFIALFIVACISIIARILRRASELDSENRQFI